MNVWCFDGRALPHKDGVLRTWVATKVRASRHGQLVSCGPRTMIFARHSHGAPRIQHLNGYVPCLADVLCSTSLRHKSDHNNEG